MTNHFGCETMMEKVGGGKDNRKEREREIPKFLLFLFLFFSFFSFSFPKGSFLSHGCFCLIRVSFGLKAIVLLRLLMMKAPSKFLVSTQSFFTLLPLAFDSSLPSFSLAYSNIIS
ncbi:Uncharacterized protein TCM_006930 [Theobroma cacao]|uniref:Transmembrane protein n=1 Tax=Theobroma cacao TaxID=3641 RepID=A0A061DZE4_THECC|nr:Uncharacterized protein TCM_006930 [Theobroma cacao]